eukprot:148101_1
MPTHPISQTCVMDPKHTCSCSYHRYILRSMSILENDSNTHPNQYIRRLICFVSQLIITITIVYFSWCAAFVYLQARQGDWYNSHGMLYLNNMLMSTCYSIFSLNIISIMFNTSMSHLPNIIMLSVATILNAIIASSLWNMEHRPTVNIFCSFLTCVDVYWIYLSSIMAVMPLLCFIAFHLTIISCDALCCHGNMHLQMNHPSTMLINEKQKSYSTVMHRDNKFASIYLWFIPIFATANDRAWFYCYVVCYCLMLWFIFVMIYCFIIQPHQIENHYTKVYISLYCILSCLKWVMKRIARQIDQTSATFIPNHALYISLEYFTQFVCAYAYFSIFRCLFLKHRIDVFNFAESKLFHILTELVCYMFRVSAVYHQFTSQVQQNVVYISLYETHQFLPMDRSSMGEFRYRMSCDIVLQFVASLVDGIFWLAWIPLVTNNTDALMAKNIMYLSISIAIDCLLFLVLSLWYQYQYKMNIIKVFVAFCTRYQYKFVWCLAITCGAISQWF